MCIYVLYKHIHAWCRAFRAPTVNITTASTSANDNTNTTTNDIITTTTTTTTTTTSIQPTTDFSRLFIGFVCLATLLL